jgi:N-acetylglucosaminyl-diphospho-decaprenol L-rhamnosyltransferase
VGDDALASLTAVVPNFETPDETSRCVAALIADGVPPGRIVVVDDASRDGSAERLESELDGPTLLRLDRNSGYGAACNAGARALSGDAYLLVNSDAFVHRPGSVAALAAVLSRPEVGIAVPRLLNPDLTVQQSVAPLHSPLVALVQATGLSRLVPNRRQPDWSTHWDHGAEREIQAAAGPVLLVRGETWAALGGFDEGAFMYAEDRDLCWRARRAGWKVWFTPAAEFVHVGSASAGARWSDAARAERVGRAEAGLLRRQLGPGRRAAALAAIRAGLVARWLVARLLGRRDAAAVFRASLRGFSSRDDG